MNSPIASTGPTNVGPDPSQWFADEVQPHEQSLRSYLSRALPTSADVDDIVQETYARLLRAKAKGEIRSTKALLFAIARNGVHDFFSRRGKLDFVPITENTVFPVLEGEADLVESICHEHELALLSEAINSLPERCREVLLLRKIKKLPQREIAKLLNITENTVESLAVKGVRRCADYLRAHGVGPQKNDAQ